MEKTSLNLRDALLAHGVLSQEEVLHVAVQMAFWLRELEKSKEEIPSIAPRRVFLDSNHRLVFKAAREEDTFSHLNLERLAFSAPEVLLEESRSSRSFLYELALLLQYLASGQMPYSWIESTEEFSRMFAEGPFRDEAPFDEELRELLEKCQSKDPKQRFANSREFLNSLGKVSKRSLKYCNEVDFSAWLARKPGELSRASSDTRSEVSPLRISKSDSFFTISSFYLFVSLFLLIVLVCFLGLFSFFDPEEDGLGDLRLVFARDNVVLRANSSCAELYWQLSDSDGQTLQGGSTRVNENGRVKLVLRDLDGGVLYVLTFFNAGKEIGKISFPMVEGSEQ